MGWGSAAGLMLLLGLSPAVARAACPEPAYLSTLEEALSLAEVTRASGSPASFEAAMREVDGVVECLREPMEPELALELHRLHGRSRQDAGLGDAALPYLAASGVEPDPSIEFGLSTNLAGWDPGHGPKLPPPLRGRLLVDGQAVDLRPSTDEPYLFQHMVGERVTATEYVHPGQGTPRYARLRGRLALAGAVGLGLGGGLVLAAELEQRRLYQDRPVPFTPSELDDLQARNHRYLMGAGAMAAFAGTSLGVLGLSYVW